MKSKKCIVSFSHKGREDYDAAQLRLIKSCVNVGWDGDYIIRSYTGYCDNYMGVDIILGSYPVTEKCGLSNNRDEVPYGFKTFIIQEAREKGYEQIIWADSSIRMVKDPKPLFDHTHVYGVGAFENLGHPLKNWISDVAVEHLHISESSLEGMQQIMACCILFDFSTPECNSIFDEWMALGRDGACFQNYGSKRPGFRAHRHDQAVLSGILAKRGVPLLPYGKLVYPPHDTDFTYGNDIYFVNKGVL